MDCIEFEKRILDIIKIAETEDIRGKIEKLYRDMNDTAFGKAYNLFSFPSSLSDYKECPECGKRVFPCFGDRPMPTTCACGWKSYCDCEICQPEGSYYRVYSISTDTIMWPTRCDCGKYMYRHDMEKGIIKCPKCGNESVMA